MSNSNESSTSTLKNRIELHFHTLQDNSTKEDLSLGRRVFTGQFKAKDLIKVSNHLNVRGYKKVKKSGDFSVSTGVHKDIYDSLLNTPQDFPHLNNGLSIKAKVFQRDNERKRIFLEGSSIVNGGQTQGVLKVFYEKYPDSDIKVFVKITVLIDNEDNQDLASRMAVSSNNQHKVAELSKVGSAGLLDELDKFTDKKITKSETDKIGNDYFSTLKLIQVCNALMPKSVWEVTYPKLKYSKNQCYSGSTTWLNRFKEIQLNTDEYKVAHKFFMDIANSSIELYENMRSNKFVITKFLKDGDGNPIGYKTNNQKVEIMDGVIFPLLAMIGEKTTKDNNRKWIIAPFSQDAHKSIAKILFQYSGVKDHNDINRLGKNTNSYVTPIKIMAGENLEKFHKEDS